jgi:hypothetical protein
MATSALVTHCGAREVPRDQLDRVEPPPPTDTWFPVKHATVIDTVGAALEDAGFSVKAQKFALSRGDHRLFCTMDLASPLSDGVAVAVGVRNSTDKSLPLGFCAGSRVFVCDNLAFRSELMVRRKHSRFGQERFREAICQAVGQLQAFKANEERRIFRLRHALVSDELAESYMLRGYERGVVSHRLLPLVIREWRQPSTPRLHEGSEAARLHAGDARQRPVLRPASVRVGVAKSEVLLQESPMTARRKHDEAPTVAGRVPTGPRPPSGGTGEGRRPVREIVLWPVKAAVWPQQGERGTFYTVTFSRIYRDRDGQWQRSESFGRDELLVLAKVADLAHSWIFQRTAGQHQPQGQARQPGDDHEEVPL